MDDGEKLAWCALAPVPVQQVREANVRLGSEMKGLLRQGVIVDNWGIVDGRLLVTLDRHTKPGSVEIVKSVIGSAGLCIATGGRMSVAL